MGIKRPSYKNETTNFLFLPCHQSLLYWEVSTERELLWNEKPWHNWRHWKGWLSTFSTVKIYQICQTLFCKQFYYISKKDLEQSNKQTNKQTNKPKHTILNLDCSRLHICHDYTSSNLFSPSTWFLVHMNKSNQLLFLLSVTLLYFYVVL